MKQAVRLAIGSAAVVLTCLISTGASAGIADSPLPELEAGKKTLHLYSVPGVRGGGCFGTYFSCTSVDTTSQQVGVELFFSGGGAPVNDAAGTSLSVAPGATVTFGTSTPADFGISSSLGFISSQGSARILSTSKKLACTVFIADRCDSPVAFMNHLTIIKKTTQKAAN